jgi:hypothetical protein
VRAKIEEGARELRNPIRGMFFGLLRLGRKAKRKKQNAHEKKLQILDF